MKISGIHQQDSMMLHYDIYIYIYKFCCSKFIRTNLNPVAELNTAFSLVIIKAYKFNT